MTDNKHSCTLLARLGQILSFRARFGSAEYDRKDAIAHLEVIRTDVEASRAMHWHELGADFAAPHVQPLPAILHAVEHIALSTLAIEEIDRLVQRIGAAIHMKDVDLSGLVIPSQADVAERARGILDRIRGTVGGPAVPEAAEAPNPVCGMFRSSAGVHYVPLQAQGPSHHVFPMRFGGVGDPEEGNFGWYFHPVTRAVRLDRMQFNGEMARVEGLRLSAYDDAMVSRGKGRRVTVLDRIPIAGEGLSPGIVSLNDYVLRQSSRLTVSISAPGGFGRGPEDALLNEGNNLYYSAFPF